MDVDKLIFEIKSGKTKKAVIGHLVEWEANNRNTMGIKSYLAICLLIRSVNTAANFEIISR